MAGLSLVDMVREECRKDNNTRFERSPRYANVFASIMRNCMVRKYLLDGIESIDVREIELLMAIGITNDEGLTIRESINDVRDCLDALCNIMYEKKTKK